MRRCKALGFTLEETSELLRLNADPKADRAEVRALTERRLADVDAKLRELQVLRDSLAELATTCSGNGLNEYDPSEVIPNNTVSWPWFIGKDCVVEPGTYRLKVSYSMTRPNWPEKRLRAISNEFKVTAPEKT